MSRKAWDMDRQLNLLAAMGKCVEADIKIPTHWIDELNDLNETATIHEADYLIFSHLIHKCVGTTSDRDYSDTHHSLIKISKEDCQSVEDQEDIDRLYEKYKQKGINDTKENSV